MTKEQNEVNALSSLPLEISETKPYEITERRIKALDQTGQMVFRWGLSAGLVKIVKEDDGGADAC
jgi:hypothetical protein